MEQGVQPGLLLPLPPAASVPWEWRPDRTAAKQRHTALALSVPLMLSDVLDPPISFLMVE
jgi:hypothetical protein